MNRSFIEKKASEHGVPVSPSLIALCRDINKAALEGLAYEFESHDYFSEAKKVRSYITTETHD